MIVEGIHFTAAVPATGVGHKALASNISDIASMGGTALYAVVSLGVRASTPWRTVSGIYQGMVRTAKKFGVHIVGGDTVKSRQLIINVALVGKVRKKDLVFRQGARPGDRIFVTGPLGRSLESGWHWRFTPRVAQAQFLVRTFKPRAMIDISDGLIADLERVLAPSRVGAVLDASSIPLRKGAGLENAFYDGEDFELLLTLSPEKARRLKNSKGGGFSFYQIGEIVDRRHGIKLRSASGHVRAVKVRGYAHF